MALDRPRDRGADRGGGYRREGCAMGLKRPAVLVISEWLSLMRPGQWTPFEAASRLKDALRAEGYVIVPQEQWRMPAPPHSTETP